MAHPWATALASAPSPQRRPKNRSSGIEDAPRKGSTPTSQSGVDSDLAACARTARTAATLPIAASCRIAPSPAGTWSSPQRGDSPLIAAVRTDAKGVTLALTDDDSSWTHTVAADGEVASVGGNARLSRVPLAGRTPARIGACGTRFVLGVAARGADVYAAENSASGPDGVYRWPKAGAVVRGAPRTRASSMPSAW